MRLFLSVTALFFWGVLSSRVLAAAPVTRTDQAAGTPEQIAAGAVRYGMCVGCHDTSGEGRVGLAPRINSDTYLRIASNDLLTQTIVQGRPGTTMMAWGNMMSQEDIGNVVAFIRSWQKSDSLPLMVGPLKGDVEVGSALYMKICATCHGPTGAGYQEAGAGTGLGRKGFLDQVSDGELRGFIKYGKDSTAMRPFSEKSAVAVANLSDDEIDSIIKFLRANTW